MILVNSLLISTKELVSAIDAGNDFQPGIDRRKTGISCCWVLQINGGTFCSVMISSSPSVALGALCMV